MKKLITIVGPTAIGKTSFSIALAQKLNTEIVSCDSRQFYHEIPIGTAIPTQEERAGITHHCLGQLSIHDRYSVGDYEKDALRILDTIFAKKDTAILVGGSGLYERAVNEGLNEFPDIPPEIKIHLNQKLQLKGMTYLQNELQKRDPEYYKKVDINNPQRLIRALEVCLFTAETYSCFIAKPKKNRDFECIKIGLTAERDWIYSGINQRVENMIKNGLLEEAQKVFPYKQLNALQTVGYRELFDYFEQKIDLPTATEEIKKNTRRYAKRQLTWYRKDQKIQWLHPQECSDFIHLSDF